MVSFFIAIQAHLAPDSNVSDDSFGADATSSLPSDPSASSKLGSAGKGELSIRSGNVGVAGASAGSEVTIQSGAGVVVISSDGNEKVIGLGRSSPMGLKGSGY